MSGGVDPYYQSDPPNLECKEGQDKKASTKDKPKSAKGKHINLNEIKYLFFSQHIPFSEIAKRLGVCLSEVRQLFKQQGWRARSRKYTDEDIRRLYLEKGLLKSEIAKRPRISPSTIDKAFKRNNWKSCPPPKKANPEDAYKLLKKGITREEIAKELGVHKRTVDRYLKELGVESRWGRDKKKYKTSEERLKAKRKQSRKRLARVKKKRDEVFGTECRVCGIEKGEGRKIAVHKKDCQPHNETELWTMGHLKAMNPDEWAALCVMCHRGIHWTHSDLGMDWQDVERYVSQKPRVAREKKTLLPDPTGEVHHVYAGNKQLQDLDDVDEIKKEIFGEECYFCGQLPDDKRLTIHRKDGAPHGDKHLKTKEGLLGLDPAEWQAMCTKHHRYVHWAMRRLGMKWADIEARNRKMNNRSKGMQ